jgi:hypothetical protein
VTRSTPHNASTDDDAGAEVPMLGKLRRLKAGALGRGTLLWHGHSPT